MALILFCARLVDEAEAAPDEEQARQAKLLLDILTPMAKSWPSEFCLEDNNRASASAHDRAFYQGKLQACQFFFRYELPKVTTQANLLKKLDDTCLSMPDDSF